MTGYIDPAAIAAHSTRLLLMGAAAAAMLIAGLVLDVVLLGRAAGTKPLIFRLRLDAVRARPWTALDAALLLLVFLGVNLWVGLMVAGVRQFGGVPADRLAGIALVAQTLLVPLATVAVAAAVLRRRGVSWGEACGWSAAPWLPQVRQAVVFYLAALPPVLLSSLAYLSVLVRLGYPVDGQDVIRLLADPSQPLWLLVYLTVLAVTVAPFAEELLFRGILLPALLKRAAPWSAIVFVSLFFAGLHLHVPAVVPLFVLAMAFSLAYVATGSLLVPMIMHALFNAVSLAVLFGLRDLLSLGG